MYTEHRLLLTLSFPNSSCNPVLPPTTHHLLHQNSGTMATVILGTSPRVKYGLLLATINHNVKIKLTSISFFYLQQEETLDGQ